ncbi:hypothetical protein BpHYR1_020594 [Brachionus plicatilis]|uniref:Uncharacterized protein n=1 Tax=Brachionus plicatilis TaxID=10195 RepID=A0A3M7RDN6_BRAPC|nr:hypothetical protein BpHYR1_020594 [Brachionus plicatilis]
MMRFVTSVYKIKTLGKQDKRQKKRIKNSSVKFECNIHTQTQHSPFSIVKTSRFDVVNLFFKSKSTRQLYVI